MVNRGHSLQALLYDYPIDLVWNLYRAAIDNQEMQARAEIMGLSMAVVDALDISFNAGKNKVLETWIKNMDTPKEKTEKRPAQKRLSPETIAFFGGSPVVMKTSKDSQEGYRQSGDR